MRLFFAAVCVLFALQAITSAEPTRFPYEAIVDADEADVRSGPSRQYYPTMKLHRGDRVVVQRHDLGGWYAIAPPKGSFSWIRSEYVRKTAPDRGVVTQDRIVIRVGSALADVRDVEQIRLSMGSNVTILGEETVQTEIGPTHFYKIAPPEGEFRWIMGQHLIPADAIPTGTIPKDPFGPVAGQSSSGARGAGSGQNPKAPELADESPFRTQNSLAGSNSSTSGSRTSQSSGQQNGLKERPVVRLSPDAGVVEDVKSEMMAIRRNEMKEIDGRFRAMLEAEPDKWDLDRLAADYSRLKNETESNALASELELRFGAIEKYRKVRNEWQTFVSLTEETARRDAQLLSMQQKPSISQSSTMTAPDPTRTRPAPTATPRPAGVPQVAERTAPAGTRPGNSAGLSAPVPGRNPQGYSAQSSSPQSGSAQSRSAQASTQVSRSPQFDGAGIVQRSALSYPGAPRHVLLTPDGRVLAYLQPAPGVNLDAAIGRAMGLVGQRGHRPDLRADLIVVQQYMPVRLRVPSATGN